jgi:hypothetical protein
LALLLGCGSAQAATVTIDFVGATEPVGNITVDPNGFTFTGGGEIWRMDLNPDYLPAGSGLFMDGGNLVSGGRIEVSMTRQDGVLFDLQQMDVNMFDPAGGTLCGPCLGPDSIISAYDENDNLIAQQTVYVADGIGFQTIVFDSGWSGISSLKYEGQEELWESSVAQINNIKVNVVPIPAAVWLFGSALAGLGWFRRRQTA